MSDADLKSKSESKTQRPKKYTIVCLNDDFTPIDFVIDTMVNCFGLPVEEAAQVTMKIHNSGRGNAGIFTLEIAEMKVMQAMDRARQQEYPFTCTAEPA